MCGRCHQKEINGEEHPAGLPVPRSLLRVAVHPAGCLEEAGHWVGSRRTKWEAGPGQGRLENAGEPVPIWVERQLSCASLPSVAGFGLLGCGFWFIFLRVLLKQECYQHFPPPLSTSPIPSSVLFSARSEPRLGNLQSPAFPGPRPSLFLSSLPQALREEATRYC